MIHTNLTVIFQSPKSTSVPSARPTPNQLGALYSTYSLYTVYRSTQKIRELVQGIHWQSSPYLFQRGRNGREGKGREGVLLRAVQGVISRKGKARMKGAFLWVAVIKKPVLQGKSIFFNFDTWYFFVTKFSKQIELKTITLLVWTQLSQFHNSLNINNIQTP